MECNERSEENCNAPQVIESIGEAGIHLQEDTPAIGGTPLWKRLLPFAVAGGILAYLFSKIDVHQCLAALLKAEISLYLPLLAVFILLSFLMDVQNLMAMLRLFQYRISFRDAMSIRGVTYLLMTVDYSLGLGALIYYLKRNLAIPVMRSTGLMIFFNGVTHFTLVTMAIAGLLILRPASRLLDQFLIFSICFIAVDLSLIAGIKALPPRGLMLKIKNFNLISAFNEVAWSGMWLLTFWRAVYYALFIIFFYVAVRAFHMDIPLITLLAYVPIILLVISLPIAPCGFGTAQAAMIYLFKGFGTSENIMAFGLTYSTSIIVLRSLIGLFFTHPFSRVKPEKYTVSKNV